MIEKEFTIKEPNISIRNSILIAFILTTYSAICYYFITTNDDKNTTLVYLIILGFFVIKNMVLPNLTTKSIHLNFTHKKIKYETSVGPFGINKKWKNLKNLEYISVFKTENGYEVNLWHNKNEIINLFVYENYEDVVKEAFIIAEKLDIELLDARKRGYHQWIDKDIYKTTGEIEYYD
ncbi:hypothetical protein [uncultured Winogradskyella sp.]|uniref:hypothetical protein n=1 Tax=uncultured Winogradskyella sp. TaxID=395353 RepID=UPI00260411BA|nr:hypothetical protein [uncultured Winogradskyella sp.]